MSRAAFIGALREGLSGMAPAARDEVIADYEAHFDEGAAAGRSESDIAAALGDPQRLARELRAEAGLKRWEEQRNPSNAAAAVLAVLGLGAIDILVLLPILLGVTGTLIGIFFGVVGMFVAGSVAATAGPFAGAPGGPAAAILLGIGLMAAATCGIVLLILIGVGLVNALVWYARLHFRLLKPAIEP